MLRAAYLISRRVRKLQHIAADAAQEFRVALRLRAAADKGDSLAAVQHPVAGGAIAAEELRFARIEPFSCDAHCENHGARLVKVVCHRNAEAAAQRHHRQRAPRDKLRTALFKLRSERGGHLLPAHGRHPRKVVHAFRFIHARCLDRICNYRDGLAAAARSQRRGCPRRASADDDQIIHSSSLRFLIKL